jgi:protein-disulfide isomerase
MWKLSTSLIAASLIAGAAEFSIEKFVKNTLVRNPRIKVEKVTPVAEKELPGRPDWKVYMFTMDLKIGKKREQVPEMIFINTKENLAAMSLIDMKSGEDLRSSIKPDMPESFYDEKHLIAGNPDAPNKMVVFSDPQCPFCIQFVPGLIKEIKAHPDKVALYYYHMPLLRLHPVSDTLTKVMEHLQKQGRTDDALKMYKLKINPRLKDEKKILAEVKKQLGIDVSPDAINKSEIKSAVKSDMDKAASMMVRGTPTVYFNGKYDPSREAYKKALK